MYLPPADARAAFESGNVDAWVVWDPYYAAAQNALKVRTLSDTGLAATNNFYEATRDFAQQHPDVVGAILKQARETGQWVNTHPADTAALIAPKVGLPQPIVETWIKRVPFGGAARRKDRRGPATRRRCVLCGEADSAEAERGRQRMGRQNAQRALAAK